MQKSVSSDCLFDMNNNHIKVTDINVLFNTVFHCSRQLTFFNAVYFSIFKGTKAVSKIQLHKNYHILLFSNIIKNSFL